VILAYFGNGLLGVCIYIYGSIKRHAGVHAKSGEFGRFIFEPWPCGMSHGSSQNIQNPEMWTKQLLSSGMSLIEAILKLWAKPSE
jgi:hypothetical protein